MRSSSDQAKFRKAVFLEHKKSDEAGRVYLVCHICGTRIDPATQGWEADHVIPDAFDGKDGMPAHIRCHKQKTATQDVPAIAKSKRVSDRHFGLKRRGWNTGLRKKMNGEVVPK